jgi:hypothetical protein
MDEIEFKRFMERALKNVKSKEFFDSHVNSYDDYIKAKSELIGSLKTQHQCEKNIKNEILHLKMCVGFAIKKVIENYSASLSHIETMQLNEYVIDLNSDSTKKLNIDYEEQKIAYSVSFTNRILQKYEIE